MKYTAFYLTHRYFVCHPESVAELWKENLILFRSNPTYRSANSIWEPVPHELTLEHQFFLLPCLPNFHRWKWDKCVNITRFCQRFPTSCRFYPGPPCNQIIQTFFLREESDQVIGSCVKNFRSENTTVTYVNRKRKKTWDQEIDCDISSEVLKISLFMYYWKNDGSVYNL